MLHNLLPSKIHLAPWLVDLIGNALAQKTWRLHWRLLLTLLRFHLASTAENVLHRIISLVACVLVDRTGCCKEHRFLRRACKASPRLEVDVNEVELSSQEIQRSA